MPVFIEYSTENTQFLAFISAAALAFVGVACCYECHRLTRIVHLAAAIICAICAVSWTLLNVEFGFVIVILSGLIFIGIGLIK